MRRDVIYSICICLAVVCAVLLVADIRSEAGYVQSLKSKVKGLNSDIRTLNQQLNEKPQDSREIESKDKSKLNDKDSQGKETESQSDIEEIPRVEKTETESEEPANSIKPSESSVNSENIIIRHYKNTSDPYQMKWIPYLHSIYDFTNKYDNKCWPPPQYFNHSFAKPLLTCADADLPRPAAAATRQQLHVTCEGGVARGEYRTVPLRSQYSTMGQDAASRRCLTAYINQRCQDQYPIPDVVHWVWIGDRGFTELWAALSIISIHTILRPKLVLIHGFHPTFDGYWDVVAPLGRDVIFVPKATHTHTTTGVKIKNVQNMADIARLDVLQEFGGMYIDTDVAVLKPVDIFRAVAWAAFSEGNGPQITNAVMFARRDHPFTAMWLKNWATYGGTAWQSHSIDYYSRMVKKVLPVGVVQHFAPMFHWLGWWPNDRRRLYRENCDVFDTFGQHLYHKVDYLYGIKWPELKKSNTTYGRIARYILHGDANLCPSTTAS